MNKIKKIKDYISNNKLDLDRIIEDYTPYIKTVINNSAINYLSQEDKEEILEDTFVILWENQYKDIIYLEAYIASIARNLVKEKIRKNTLTYDISEYENIIPYYDNIDFFSDELEILNRLKLSYNNLKPIDFKIISLYYYSSKSIKEVAKELKISESNVKTKLFRIRKKLKKYLI